MSNMIGEIRRATNPRQAEKNGWEEETFRSATDAGFETTRRTAKQAAQTTTDARRRATPRLQTSCDDYALLVAIKVVSGG
jgi:hypothetical protein